MRKRLVFSYLLLLITALFLSGCGCGGGDEAPVLTSIEVSPANPGIALGTDQQFRAIGLFSDNTTLDITEAVAWTTSDTTIATISNDPDSMGLAHGLGTGVTTVTATSGGITGSTGLTVTAAELTAIEVTPVDPSIGLGASMQFTATGIFTDGSRQDITAAAEWSSSATSVATVGNTAGTKGRADSKAAGVTTITASSQGISGSTTLTVTAATLASIEVTPATASVQRGATQQFTATGVYTDQSRRDITASVTWSSSNTPVATISNAAGSRGLASGLSGGNTTITATLGGISGSASLTVRTVSLVSIRVTPENPTAGFGSTIQFHATGTYSDASMRDITTVVTWSSSDTSIATVSNAPGSQGLATTDHKAGVTTITATLEGVSGSTLLIDP